TRSGSPGILLRRPDLRRPAPERAGRPRRRAGRGRAQARGRPRLRGRRGRGARRRGPGPAAVTAGGSAPPFSPLPRLGGEGPGGGGERGQAADILPPPPLPLSPEAGERGENRRPRLAHFPSLFCNRIPPRGTHLSNGGVRRSHGAIRSAARPGGPVEGIR